MPKSKQFRSHASAFRLLLFAGGALMVMAAFAPRANAQNEVLVYFNFEDATIPGPPDFESDETPAAGGDNPGGGIQHSTITTNFQFDGAIAGLTENRTAGDIDTVNDVGLGLRTTVQDNFHFIQFQVNATAFSNMTLSFAINTAGNGFNSVTLNMSANGVTFVPVGTRAIASGPPQILSFTIPAAFSNQPTLFFQLQFDGGTSMGNNLETIIDNIQLVGVPEPTTVAGGLFGVLGLCWFQRRRLIRAVRSQPT
jgi:hypothetical protein